MPVAVFLPILVFRGKGISNGSKRNETFARIFLGANAIQENRMEVRDAMRRPRGRRARPGG